MSPRISDLFVYYSACVIIILFSLVSDWLPGTDRDREDRLPNRSHKHITKKKAPFPDCERWSERNDGLKRKQQSSPDGPIFVKQPLLLLLQLCVYFTTGSRGACYAEHLVRPVFTHPPHKTVIMDVDILCEIDRQEHADRVLLQGNCLLIDRRVQTVSLLPPHLTVWRRAGGGIIEVLGSYIFYVGLETIWEANSRLEPRIYSIGLMSFLTLYSSRIFFRSL